MPNPLSGPGVGLPLAQQLYPANLAIPNTPISIGGNEIGLGAGDQLPIPAGTWLVNTGSYCVLQFLDPLTGTWRASPDSGWGGLRYVKSDGFNVRIANMLGCPVGGVVIAPGNGSYVQASTSISVAGGGGSTWAPIVGGQLGGVTILNAGAGYGVAPIVYIPAPRGPNTNPNGVGGLQAVGYASISSGTVNGVTLTNPGAGYQGTTIGALLLPNPTDPNLATGITAGSIAISVIGAGSLVGVLCTNPGAPLSNPANITLTVAGAGANGTVSPVVMQTVTAISVVGSSTLAGVSGAAVTSQGGYPQQGTFTNSPNYLYLAGRARPLAGNLSVGGTGTLAAQVGTIYDSGLFYSTPTAILETLQTAQGVGSVTGSSTIALTMGSRPDIVTIQPGP